MRRFERAGAPAAWEGIVNRRFEKSRDANFVAASARAARSGRPPPQSRSADPGVLHTARARGGGYCGRGAVAVVAAPPPTVYSPIADGGTARAVRRLRRAYPNSRLRSVAAAGSSPRRRRSPAAAHRARRPRRPTPTSTSPPSMVACHRSHRRRRRRRRGPRRRRPAAAGPSSPAASRSRLARSRPESVSYAAVMALERGVGAARRLRRRLPSAVGVRNARTHADEARADSRGVGALGREAVRVARRGEGGGPRTRAPSCRARARRGRVRGGCLRKLALHVRTRRQRRALPSPRRRSAADVGRERARGALDDLRRARS